jgi:hypothetical protein
VKKAWELAFSFLFKLKMLIIEDQPRKALILKQCIFNGRLPNNLRTFSLVWALLCGIALWSIWIKRNDLIFNSLKWHDVKLRRVMWDSLLDYGKMERKHTLAMIQKYLEKRGKLLELFDKIWCPHQVICARAGKKIRWCYQPPLAIIYCGNC